MQNFKNILVVRTDRIGDVVLTVPALRALKKAFPAAQLSLWVSAATVDLVKGLSGVNAVLVEDTSRGWRGYFEFVSMLMDKEFDLVINYHPKRRTNAACFLAGIPKRLGYRNNKFGFFLNCPVADRRHLGEKHEAEYCLDLLKAIGVESSDLTLDLAQNYEAEQWAERFFREELGGKPAIVIHPDASDPVKCWPADSFGQLGDRLAAEFGARIIIVGGASARRLVPAISQHLHHDSHDLTGSLSLARLVSLLRRSRLLISNDSGPVHIAAAVKIPVISLFLRVQPGINPERWRPLGARSLTIVNRKGEEILLDGEGRIASGKADSITVEDVLHKARILLNSKP